MAVSCHKVKINYNLLYITINYFYYLLKVI